MPYVICHTTTASATAKVFRQFEAREDQAAVLHLMLPQNQKRLAHMPSSLIERWTVQIARSHLYCSNIGKTNNEAMNNSIRQTKDMTFN
eukprot:scaffold669624_cov73-Prasinocladus_malaysianus.AAC.1